jgi:hypothetical protein
VKRFKCAIEKQVCFGGGARPRRPRVWKTKPTRGTDAKSKKLVELVSNLSSPEQYKLMQGFEAIVYSLEHSVVCAVSH